MRRCMLVLSFVLAGCAGPPSAPASTAASPTPEAGATDSSVLFVAVAEPDHPDPAARSGAAGQLVDCDAGVSNGSTASNVGGPPTGGSTPEEGLALFLQQGLFSLPGEDFRLAAHTEDRALFLYDVDGRARVAVIVALAGSSEQVWHDRGWGVETFATCDPAEYAPAADDELPLSVWVDGDGNRVSTSSITTRQGHEHCGWQRVTFLQLGERQFVRDADAVIPAERLAATYQADAVLPPDAVDTGFRQDARALWLAADGTAAYLVDEQRVERWPAARDRILCS